jgi:hypothetical protein
MPSATAIDHVQSAIRGLDTALDDLRNSLDASPSGEVSEADLDDRIRRYMDEKWEFDASSHNILDEDEVQSKCEYEAESAIDSIDWADKVGNEVDEAVENVDWNSKFNDHLDLQKEMDDWAANVYLTKDEINDLIWETLSEVMLVSRENVLPAASDEEEEAVNA